MASNVRVRLTAKDEASSVFNKFKSNANNALNSVENKSKTSAKNSGSAFENLGRTFTRTVGAITGIGVGVTALRKLGQAAQATFEIFGDFERAQARLLTLGGSLEGRFDEIRDRVLAMNPALGDSTKLINGVFDAITRGANVDNAFVIVELAAKAANGQLADFNEVIGLTQQVSAAFNVEGEELKRVMDGLVSATQVGNVTFSSLVQPLGQVAGLAGQVGLSAEETANAIGILSIAMKDTRLAGTGLRAILNQVVGRIDEFRDAGIPALEILQGPNGFVNLMRAIGEATGPSAERLRDLFTNIRAFNAAGIASNAVLGKLEDAQRRLGDAAGLTEENFNTMRATVTGPGGALEQVSNAFSTMVSKIAGEDSSRLQNALITIANGFIATGNAANQIRSPLVFLAATVDIVAASIISLVDSIINAPNRVASGFAAIGSVINDAVGTIATDIAGAFDRADGSATKVSTALRGVGQNMKEAADIGADFAEDNLNLDSTLNQLANDGLAKSIEGYQKSIELAGELGVQTEFLSLVTLDDIQAGQKAAEARANTANQTQGVIDKQEELIKQTPKIEKVNGVWTNIGTAVEETSKEVTKSVGEITTSQQQVVTSTSTVKTAVAETSESYAKIVKNGVEYSIQNGKISETNVAVAQSSEEAGKKVGQFSQAVVGTLRNAEEFDKAWSKTFDTTRNKAELTAKRAVETFQTLAAEGVIPAKTLAEALESELEKAEKLLGPNAPTVRQMKSMLEALEREAGTTNNRLERIFDEMGISISLPVEDAPRKYREAFNEMIASGELTQAELHKIFVEQIKPALLETVEGVPAAWEAKFGEASAIAQRLEDNVTRNLERIGSTAETEASKIQAEFEAAFQGSEVAAQRFHGTWLEQLEARERALGNSSTSSGSSSSGSGSSGGRDDGPFADFEGTRDTSLDDNFGGPPPEISFSFADDLQGLRDELAFLDSIPVFQRGGDFVAQREEIIRQIRELQAQEQAAEDEARRENERARQEFIASQQEPLIPSSVGGIDETQQAFAELSREMDVLRFRQEQVTQPLDQLLPLQRQWETSIANLQQDLVDTLNTEGDIVEVEGIRMDRTERIAFLQAEITANEQALHDVILQINDVRLQELHFVEQIRDTEAEINRLIENRPGPRQAASSFASFSPSSSGGGGSGGGGAAQAASGEQTDQNTRATDQNTSALERLSEASDLSGGQITEGGGFLRGPTDVGIPGGFSGVQLESEEQSSLAALFGATNEDSGSLVLGQPGSGVSGIFDNGGVVPEDGVFRLQAGERVLTAMQFEKIIANAARNARFGVGSDAFGSADQFRAASANNFASFRVATGETDVIAQGSTEELFRPTTSTGRTGPQAGFIARAAARGRIEDELGPTGQRELAKAIVPGTRKSIRRRDITTDITRNTSLSRQGQATVK